jgi:hypothetical protein
VSKTVKEEVSPTIEKIKKAKNKKKEIKKKEYEKIYRDLHDLQRDLSKQIIELRNKNTAQDPQVPSSARTRPDEVYKCASCNSHHPVEYICISPVQPFQAYCGYPPPIRNERISE